MAVDVMPDVAAATFTAGGAGQLTARAAGADVPRTSSTDSTSFKHPTAESAGGSDAHAAAGTPMARATAKAASALAEMLAGSHGDGGVDGLSAAATSRDPAGQSTARTITFDAGDGSSSSRSAGEALRLLAESSQLLRASSASSAPGSAGPSTAASELLQQAMDLLMHRDGRGGGASSAATAGGGGAGAAGGAGGAWPSAAPSGVLERGAAIARQMTNQLRMHRAMVHRHQEQLLQYGDLVLSHIHHGVGGGRGGTPSTVSHHSHASGGSDTPSSASARSPVPDGAATGASSESAAAGTAASEPSAPLVIGSAAHVRPPLSLHVGMRRSELETAIAQLLPSAASTPAGSEASSSASPAAATDGTAPGAPAVPASAGAPRDPFAFLRAR